MQTQTSPLHSQSTHSVHWPRMSLKHSSPWIQFQFFMPFLKKKGLRQRCISVGPHENGPHADQHVTKANGSEMSLGRRLLATPWTVARQAPLSMDFPGKNTGVGYGLVLRGILPTQGWNPRLLPVSCIGRWVLYH